MVAGWLCGCRKDQLQTDEVREGTQLYRVLSISVHRLYTLTPRLTFCSRQTLTKDNVAKVTPALTYNCLRNYRILRGIFYQSAWR